MGTKEKKRKEKRMIFGLTKGTKMPLVELNCWQERESYKEGAK